ncbi:SMC family ATPase [Curtobacterium sp. Csp1]|uniref:Nuclease SbcCD subunit C n=1 Tax=Curtobacterium citreum TaxID=2036 RepID=A0ABT2HJK5_9MICO|nr:MULTISPECIES: SMC family ATPase [Curtobacterium]MCS6523297.1 SMC family ATPase [Curtobacterium citreum]QKS12409.1 SMC family ATPase [Curtobacterium sp. csp3]QKS19993.1 SMC family ATPase [Curtobacterium sp. Csp1]TQJ26969.1 exonuclease SbcC [Curtobacterium citreum]GGL90560.1 nuclease SbcCD subunit C [Curtobacterium citreum]
MYLHRLELRAIGPYPDTVVIDFAALAASGVFLLEGPTGSGKSTIIDAVVFALYGGLAGESSTPDRLHSQHADPATEPFVELVFETGAGLFRVRRTPQYDRPKQRGTGTVRQQASAQLFRLAHPADPAGEPVSSRIPEIGLEVTRIVGLDRAQFLQTVVLPQGEFARFLRSPGEERRKLLQSLFGTQVYDRTADELAARRRAVLAEVEGAESRVRDAQSRFAQAAGVEDPDERAVDDVVAGLRSVAAETDEHRRAAVSDAERARERERSVRERVTARERRAALLDRRRALDAAADEVTAARDRLALGERATRVATSADALDAARARAAQATDAAASQRQGAGLDADTDVVGLRTALADCLSDVRHLVAVERTFATRRRSAADAAVRAEDLAARSAALVDALERRPAERATIVESARTAAALAADAEPARVEVERVAQLRADLSTRVTAARAQEQAERAVASARAAATAALATETDLRARRIAGLAGELGAALQPGDACPVCGAVEHPSVAVPQDDHPSADAVESAASAARAAEAALAAAATDLALAQQEHERLRTVLGDLDADTLEARATAAAERVRAAHDAAVQVLDLERRRSAHDEQTRALEQERTTVASEHAVLVSSAAAESERLAQDTAAVDAAVRRATGALDAGTSASTDTAAGGSSLADAVRALDDRVAELDAVLAADVRAATAAASVAERQSEVTEVCAEQGFESVERARAALVPAAEGERLRAVVATADRERAVVDAGLTEAAVAEAARTADEPLDLTAAVAARDSAVERADAATRVAVSAADRLEAAARCGEDVARAVRARESTSARSRAVVRLADVAAGSTSVNPSGITLGTYVLMRRFEDVVAAANDRLRGMLGGRFTLETSEERETGSRARKTGLALAVHDHTTDTLRAPGSLSGGETFTVSLCLALGLADVVQAEAGGVALGTLFVDEGFGTLDPETLDDVIGQLARLTAGGRQVGIVSHVEELKQRIPERIAVRRTPGGGSRVTTTV